MGAKASILNTANVVSTIVARTCCAATRLLQLAIDYSARNAGFNGNPRRNSGRPTRLVIGNVACGVRLDPGVARTYRQVEGRNSRGFWVDR